MLSIQLRRVIHGKSPKKCKRLHFLEKESLLVIQFSCHEVTRPSSRRPTQRGSASITWHATYSQSMILVKNFFRALTFFRGTVGLASQIVIAVVRRNDGDLAWAWSEHWIRYAQDFGGRSIGRPETINTMSRRKSDWLTVLILVLEQCFFWACEHTRASAEGRQDGELIANRWTGSLSLLQTIVVRVFFCLTLYKGVLNFLMEALPLAPLWFGPDSMQLGRGAQR